MKKILFLVGLSFVLMFGSSYAINQFNYENALEIANKYVTDSNSLDENWKGKNPRIEKEGKYFYTDTDSPSYVEFKVSCDENPDCGFVMVNFDGNDVSIPIASTSGNTPSEILIAQNGGSDKDNKLYYLNPFEQYSEDLKSGEVSSIDPQDNIDSTLKSNTKLSDTEKKEKRRKFKDYLKTSLYSKIKEFGDYKNTEEFKTKINELKDKKKTILRDEVGFKILPLVVADNGGSGFNNYIPPVSSDIFIPGNSTANCSSRTPCYDQPTKLINGIYYDAGCSPTALGIIYGYYDRQGTFPNLVQGIAADYSSSTSPNYYVKNMINSIRSYMQTFYTLLPDGNYAGSTYVTNIANGVNYAINKGYSGSIAQFMTGSSLNLFPVIQTEVNEGRPVLINNSTHSMVAYGYNSTSGLPIVRLNLGLGNSYTKNSSGAIYYYSSIDLNMDSMFYLGVEKTPIDSLVTFKLAQ